MKADSLASTPNHEFLTLAGTDISGDNVPDRIVVVPWGTINSTKGAFVVDDEAATSVVDTFSGHKTDLPIDYEHQTLGGIYSSPKGTAPAAGWITQLTAAPGEGIIADVNWTDEARKMLAARQYRYLSPVAIVRKDDRKIMSLHSVALTNKPAIVGMTAIVNRQDDEKAELQVARLRETLAVDDTTPLDDLLAVACDRLHTLQDRIDMNAAEHMITRAVAQGKLAPAHREWALKLANQQPQLFREWEEKAPVLITTGKTHEPRDNGNRRSAEEAARAEFNSNSALKAITTEEAYVKLAIRSNGLI